MLLKIGTPYGRRSRFLTVKELCPNQRRRREQIKDERFFGYPVLLLNLKISQKRTFTSYASFRALISLIQSNLPND